MVAVGTINGIYRYRRYLMCKNLCPMGQKREDEIAELKKENEGLMEVIFAQQEKIKNLSAALELLTKKGLN
jgi:hypothetical protein